MIYLMFTYRFSIEQSLTLTICPTAVWQKNAIIAVGDQSGTPGSNSSMLIRPTDIYIDNNNSIYVLDSGNYRVQRISVNSISGNTIVNGSNGVGMNQFLSMDAMSVDRNGSIYILDGSNGRVTKWKQGSSNVTLVAGGNGIGNSNNQLNMPSGMFIELNTSIIWIADTLNHRIVKWTSPSTSVVVCGSYGRENNQFMYPTGLFIDTSYSNTFYVADAYNHRIQMWLSGDTVGKTVAGITGYYGNGLNQLWRPHAVILDSNQYMYITDYENNRILKWMIGASSGVIIGYPINFDTQIIQIPYPRNINFDINGSLFVTDTYNNRIQKFPISCPAISTNLSTTTTPSMTTTGKNYFFCRIQHKYISILCFSSVANLNASCSMTTWYSNGTTIAGSSIGDTDYASTSLSSPYDIFIDKNDTMYVVDSFNFRVQRFQSSSTNGITVVNISYYVLELYQFVFSNFELLETLNSFACLLFFFILVRAISVDVNRSIYTLESENNRVMKWKSDVANGIIVAGGNGNGVSANQLNNPFGMYIDSKIRIWIADTSNHRIVRWENSSTGSIICGSYGTAANQFNRPNGIFVDENNGNIFYVADTDNHRIQMWSPGATSGITIAGQTGLCGDQLNRLCYPSSMITDSNRNLYIADTYNNRIMLWMKGSTSGILIAGGTTFGVLPNQLFYPQSIKLDRDGALIVADRRNNRIQKFSVLCCKFEILKTISSIYFFSYGFRFTNNIGRNIIHFCS
uniref:Gluconolactonase-like protein n=1 Tax=Adineta vaga TaxID=104782 RepID=B3G4J3_ADIVA|nr:gluconolactonase-like protein [Adineta vaga]